MEKVIRDGKVAVVISPSFGAGWYTWNNEKYKELLFHPKIVEKVEQGKNNELTEDFLKDLLGINSEEYVCDLGNKKLIIEWLDEGTAFTVEEYDGYESLKTLNDLTIIA